MEDLTIDRQTYSTEGKLNKNAKGVPSYRTNNGFVLIVVYSK